MADHNIYIGETVRVELAEEWLDVNNKIFLLTVETSESTFFSLNPLKITAINWAVKIADDDYKVRLFLPDAVIDIDPLKEVNRRFLDKVFYWRDEWEKYLIPQHRQQLDQLKRGQNND